jgi:hypothetical protein
MEQTRFRHHGHTLRQETQALTVKAMADTGCQICLAGLQLLAKTTMHSASGDDLPILVVAILRVTAPTTGQETRQMVYFSCITSKLYLICIDLMLLPNNFPHGMAVRETPMGTQTSPMQQLAKHVDLLTETLASRHTQPRGNHSEQGPQGSPPSTHKACSCPTRAQPPPRPTSQPRKRTGAD